jgi:subtilisin family serine protease
MRLGGGRSSISCDTDFTKPLVDQLRAAGVATVIAAGNDGFADAVSFPGCISTAVTLGSTTKTDTVSPFSNRGVLLDLYAPGSSITSAVPGSGFAALSGTSMAAPHVAGAFAALKSARPAGTVDDIGRALITTGVTVDRHPRIALFRAAQALSARSSQETPMVATAAADTPATLAEIAALPQDRVVRAMVSVRSAPGATAAAVTAAVKRAADVATAAGAAHVELIPGQPIVVVEGRPAVFAALARSGAVESVQMDRPARPQ